MKNGTDFGVIIKEIVTLGVEMTIGVVLLWALIVLAINPGLKMKLKVYKVIKKV